jgi:hypothetical protein
VIHDASLFVFDALDIVVDGRHDDACLVGYFDNDDLLLALMFCAMLSNNHRCNRYYRDHSRYKLRLAGNNGHKYINEHYLSSVA